MIRLAASVLFLAFALSCISDGDTGRNAANSAAAPMPDRASSLKKARSAVEPFFDPMGKRGPNDWLTHFHEPGQTFEEYVIESKGLLPPPERSVIYVQPLGAFNASQNRVVSLAVQYIQAFYGLPVKSLPARQFQFPLQPDDYRTIDYPKVRQIRTGYIIDRLLKPELPKDAAALVAFTNEDLFADRSMFYVFGQASVKDRVGVWSLSRLDDSANARTFLERTLKIGVHELGHMFGIRHCTKYECVMSGTNHLAETDSRPMDACPECMAKIALFSGVSPPQRYQKLADFCRANNLIGDAAEFSRKKAAVERAAPK